MKNLNISFSDDSVLKSLPIASMLVFDSFLQSRYFRHGPMLSFKGKSNAGINLRAVSEKQRILKS
jgi:hypothetical protein